MTFFCWRYLKNNVGQNTVEVKGNQNCLVINILQTIFYLHDQQKKECQKCHVLSIVLQKNKKILALFSSHCACLQSCISSVLTDASQSQTSIYLTTAPITYLQINNCLHIESPSADFADCPSFLARLVTFLLVPNEMSERKHGGGSEAKISH